MNGKAPRSHNGNDKRKIYQTKSRRAAAQPAVRAELAQLKRDWRDLTAAQKAERLDQDLLKDVSNDEIGDALELSSSAIRQYRKRKKTVALSQATDGEDNGANQNVQSLSTPAREVQSAPEKPSRGRDQSSRLAAVIVSFLQGRNGAPSIPPKDVQDVLNQIPVQLSCELYEPVRWHLPEKASVATIIRITKPKPKLFPEWQVKYYANWLASITISITQDWYVRDRAFKLVRQKINTGQGPKRLLRKRSAPDPRDAPNWNQLNEFEKEFCIRRWLQS